MSIRTELTDLLACAPAEHRDAIDRAARDHDAGNFAEAYDQLKDIAGFTTWHERVVEVCFQLDDAAEEDDSYD